MVGEGAPGGPRNAGNVQGLQDLGQRKRRLCGSGSPSTRMCWNISRGAMPPGTEGGNEKYKDPSRTEAPVICKWPQ